MIKLDTKSGEVTHSGLDKVTRYKWAALDKPAVFLEIDKSELTIDNDYQRHGDRTKEQKVLEIASSWSWIACGALIVGHRDGKFFVIDGWHRVLGARRRSDIDPLPCLVFDTTSKKEEAAGFRKSNTLRKPMNSVYRYRALLVEGDESAIWISHLLEQARRTAAETASPTTISCISALLKLFESNRDAVDRLWPLIVRLIEGKSLHNILLQGLVYIETKLQPPISLTDRDLSRRVLKVGYEKLLAGAFRGAEYMSKGGAKTWADGMMVVLNHGYRNRLTLSSAPETD